MGMTESMPQQENIIAASKHFRNRNRNSNRRRSKQSQETKTTEPDERCDFPEISPNTTGYESVGDLTTSNTECQAQESNGQAGGIRKINKHNSRRYSDMYHVLRTRLTGAQRRNSTPIARDLNNAESKTCADDWVEAKLPTNTPCCPDLITCCQNVATFLSEAAAKSNDKRAPTAQYIYGYMRFLFAILQLEPECCVYADIYVRRLLSNSKGNLKVHAGNWHKILVGACLLASKFTDDLTMDNRDFSAALTGCSVKFMNKLESKFVQTLNWQLHVPISEYTTRYFELASKQNTQSCDWDTEFERVKPHFTMLY